jgi:Zn-dependent protease
MDFANLIQRAAILALPLLFAITLSEAARGRVAYMLGDKTGWSMGRLSWNPANHISPVETILIPLLMLFLTKGSFIFGSAKPIPIDYRNFKNVKAAAIRIELAGPLMLLILALVWLIALDLLVLTQVTEFFFIETCKAGIFVSLSLFAFHLLPIPPLAGGRILLLTLPPRLATSLARIEPWAMWVIVLLAFVGVIGPYWIKPITQLCLSLLQLLTAPISLFFN